MPRGLLPFLVAVAAAGAAWALVLLPAQRTSSEESALVGRYGGDVPAAPLPREPLTPGERARAGKIRDALRAAAAPGTPAGIEEREPRVFAGRLPWSEVQEFLAWAAARREPVESVEVRARPEDPGQADCRLVLAAEGPR
jgi:hypothetical protein